MNLRPPTSLSVPGRAAWAFALSALLLVGAACDDGGGSSTTPANNTAADAGDDGGDAANNLPDDANNAPDDADDGEDAGDAEEDVDRPEPQNDQERITFIDETESWVFEELNADVHVVRTEGNVPHVFAEDKLDMAFVLGFVVARDRYFVMDLQRRLAQGRISQLLGDIALENDLESRYMGMKVVSQKIYEGLGEDDRAYLEAYAGGINAYIDRVVAGEVAPPSEVSVAGGILGSSNPADLMEPFTAEDVAAMVTIIVYETNFETGDPGRNDKALALDGLFEGATKAELRQAGARQDIWENLVPTFPYASAPTVGVTDNGSGGGGGGGGGGGQGGELGDPGQLRPLGLQKAVEPGVMERATRRLSRVERLLGRKEVENFGSNTWAVSGTHTEDGFALVSGDGHLPLYVPSIMYQIGMNTELFGGDGLHQAGLLITSLPLLAVGTNGKVAWSQVNPVADITDWYREELELDEDGLPVRSLFQDEWRDLEVVEETFEIANIPLLDSVGRTETVKRFVTFDGRFIFEVEGRPFEEGDTLAEGESVLVTPDGPIVPGDVDEDGKVTAISFDYTAFDITNYVGSLREFGEAESVYDYQASTRGLIGNMLYSGVVDDQGNSFFSSYQAVPCRSYLERGEDGGWMPGADPTMLIDGTQYGGFTIPSDDQGRADESFNDTDPYRCVVPFEDTPQVINPAPGYTANANNQPGPLTDDGRLDDDAIYIGGPWSSVRADSISSELQKAVDEGTASVDKMAEIQAYTRSRLGELFAPYFVAAVERARELENVDRVLAPTEQRLVDAYVADRARLDEAEMRLSDWEAAGFATPSGVETFYDQPTAQDEVDAVATMIFNAWLPRAIGATFNDEGMGAAWRYSGSRMRFRALWRFLQGRGEGNPGELASYDPDTGESVFFDDLSTADTVEGSDELLVASMGQALDFLASDPTGDAQGGFGTSDMSAWKWGLRHQVRFESLLADFLPADSDFSFLTDLFSITTDQLPLAEDMEPGDPRRALKWFPRPGDNYAVDAASPGFSGTRFTYGSGPVMRMVIAIKDGQVRGQNVIPGGQSALTDSPFFSDQAALWLGNQTMPLRYHVEDIAEGATGREHYKPQE